MIIMIVSGLLVLLALAVLNKIGVFGTTYLDTFRVALYLILVTLVIVIMAVVIGIHAYERV